MHVECAMSMDAGRNGIYRLTWLLLTLVLLGLSRPVRADQGPVEVLQSMTDTLVEIVKKDPQVVNDPARLRVIANEVVLPRVDFNTLSRWVLGKYWRSATEQQRAAFIDEFREMLLGSYLRSVSAYEDNAIVFMPLRGSRKEKLAVVNAVVEQPDGPEVNVAFRMHKGADGWLIYDVAVEGISLVATHRTTFSREIRNSGMDSLIARLHTQNEKNALLDETATTGVAAE